MRKFSEIDYSEFKEGKHIFCIGMVMQGVPQIVCRWCQQYEDVVGDKPCKGLMKVHLN